MVREILVYPNPKLKEVSKEVVSFDGALNDLLDDMYETMISSKGVGLAAIQIGVPLRVLIINIHNEEEKQPKENTIEMINPIIIEKEGVERCQEGCLSVPGFFEEIERSKYVKVVYFDRNNNECVIKDDDFLAVAIQHEIDHLNGKVFIEKLSYIKRKKFEKEWKKKFK